MPTKLFSAEIRLCATWVALLLLGMLPWSESCSADEAACTSCRNPGYWIVSTYGMAQEVGVCPQRLNYQCYHRAADGKLYKTSMANMQQQLNPTAPTCIFVHGSFVDIDSAIVDAHYTYRWLRPSPRCGPLNVIFFVWPSSDAETIILPTAVIQNGLKASHNGIYFAHLMEQIPESSPLCLMGHSHGTRVIAAGLHYRGGGELEGRLMHKAYHGGCSKRPIRAVFAAAAINHLWLNPGNRYGKALTQVDCLLNVVNHRDVALTLYPLVSPTYGRALAKTGITPYDRRQLGPYAHKVHELDVSHIVGVKHVWSNYYYRPGLARMISPYVYFQPGHGPARPLEGLARTAALEPSEMLAPGESELATDVPYYEEELAAETIDLPLPLTEAERLELLSKIPSAPPMAEVEALPALAAPLSVIVE